MLHTLGFFHTHSRPDRDDYVTVFMSHVKDRKRNALNFEKQNAAILDTLGQPYDYTSIVHYGSNYMAKRRWFGLGPFLRYVDEMNRADPRLTNYSFTHMNTKRVDI